MTKLMEELAEERQASTHFHAKFLVADRLASHLENNVKYVNKAIAHAEWHRCGCHSKITRLVQNAKAAMRDFKFTDKETSQVADKLHELKELSKNYDARGLRLQELQYEVDNHDELERGRREKAEQEKQ